MTDGDAIQRVVQGDLDAFSILLNRYHTDCLRYARRLLGNPEAAEEAVQDAFLRAFRGLEHYDHRDHFRAWLFRILVNRCRTVAAREKKRAGIFIGGDSPELPLPGTESVAGQQRDIDSALQQLAAEQREAFLLKYVEDLSYEEMSTLTGDSIPALKMRVLRARDVLRKFLGSGYQNGNG